LRRRKKGNFLWDVIGPVSRGYTSVPGLAGASPGRVLISARGSCAGDDGCINRIFLRDIREGTSGARYRYGVVVGKRYGIVLNWRKGTRGKFREGFVRRD
jgi:hypothetical protein